MVCQASKSNCWQAQGTRVSKNLYHHNNRDLFIEVSHGPFLVNNILGSKYALDNHAQGGAYVHNLFAGKIILRKMLNRATPYHAPHSTDVTGYAMVYGADDRLFQNLFIGGQTQDVVGTAVYDGCTISLEEYMAAVDVLQPGDLEIFEKVEQPAYVSGNCYLNGAKAFAKEGDKLEMADFDPAHTLEQEGEAVYLCVALPEGFDSCTYLPHCTRSLGRVRIVDAEFENPDGSPLTVDSDYLEVTGQASSVTGPLSCLKARLNRIKV